MITQQQANYRKGDPISNCGICQFYRGPGKCSQVAGDISPFGISDVFKVADNPFGSTLSANEKLAIKAMAADATDRSQQVGQQRAPLQQQRPMGPPMGSLAAQDRFQQ
jgi:hypothetical protein